MSTTRSTLADITDQARDNGSAVATASAVANVIVSTLAERFPSWRNTTRYYARDASKLSAEWWTAAVAKAKQAYELAAAHSGQAVADRDATADGPSSSSSAASAETSSSRDLSKWYESEIHYEAEPTDGTIIHSTVGGSAAAPPNFDDNGLTVRQYDLHPLSDGSCLISLCFDTGFGVFEAIPPATSPSTIASMMLSGGPGGSAASSATTNGDHGGWGNEAAAAAIAASPWVSETARAGGGVFEAYVDLEIRDYGPAIAVWPMSLIVSEGAGCNFADLFSPSENPSSRASPTTRVVPPPPQASSLTSQPQRPAAPLNGGSQHGSSNDLVDDVAAVNSSAAAGVEAASTINNGTAASGSSSQQRGPTASIDLDACLVVVYERAIGVYDCRRREFLAKARGGENGSRPLSANASGRHSADPSSYTSHDTSNYFRTLSSPVSYAKRTAKHCVLYTSDFAQLLLLNFDRTFSEADTIVVDRPVFATSKRWLAYAGSAERVIPTHVADARDESKTESMAKNVLSGFDALKRGIWGGGGGGNEGEEGPQGQATSSGTGGSGQGGGQGAALGTVVIYDTETRSPFAAFAAHQHSLQVMAFDPTGLLLATASSVGTSINVWQISIAEGTRAQQQQQRAAAAAAAAARGTSSLHGRGAGKHVDPASSTASSSSAPAAPPAATTTSKPSSLLATAHQYQQGDVTLLFRLTRGMTSATFSDIAFAPLAGIWIAASTTVGTVHFFRLPQSERNGVIGASAATQRHHPHGAPAIAAACRARSAPTSDRPVPKLCFARRPMARRPEELVAYVLSGKASLACVACREPFQDGSDGAARLLYGQHLPSFSGPRPDGPFAAMHSSSSSSSSVAPPRSAVAARMADERDDDGDNADDDGGSSPAPEDLLLAQSETASTTPSTRRGRRQLRRQQQEQRKVAASEATVSDLVGPPMSIEKAQLLWRSQLEINTHQSFPKLGTNISFAVPASEETDDA